MRSHSSPNVLLALLFCVAALSGCDKSAASTPPPAEAAANAVSPLAGKWVDPDPVYADCRLSVTFGANGSLTMGDGHKASDYDGTLAPVDGLGYFAWRGNLRSETGKSNCQADAGAKATLSFYVRLMPDGDHLGLCAEESVETCHFVLARDAGSPARAPTVGAPGLPDALAAALTNLAGPTGAPASLAPADAGPPLFVTPSGPATIACEARAAWSVHVNSLLGGVSAARCANGARVAQLTEAALSAPELNAKAGSAQPMLTPSRETLSDGSALVYFPVVAVGHGAIVLWTTTVVDKTRSHALVVQATTMGCPETPRADTPRLCTDTRGTVMAVARALAEPAH